eukprot:scaffold314866_cov27-Tisochrysis_lutea.AAC.1
MGDAELPDHTAAPEEHAGAALPLLTCNDRVSVWPFHHIAVDVEGREACRRSKGAQLPAPAAAHAFKQLVKEG